MATKSEVKRLLGKGLTGLEAAKLVLQDYVEEDHGRPGFLSKADIERIKRSLTSPSDVADYNRWIRVYQLVDYSLKEAKIAELEAETLLWQATNLLKIYHLEHRVRTILYSLPAIVTEKQYEELKAKQRDLLLSHKHKLDDVATMLEDEDEEGYLQRAVQRLLPPVRDGKVRPVWLSEEACQQLKELKAEDQVQRERWQEEPSLDLESYWRESARREDEILQAGYDAGKTLQPEEAASLLESVAGSEDAKILERLYFSSQELYEAGFLQDWIDEYKPDLDWDTMARPDGIMQSNSVAIIQEPSPHDLDERGWYKDHGLEMLTELSGYQHRSELLLGGESRTLPERLQVYRSAACEQIKLFLAIQAIVEAVSQIIEVDLGEDLDQSLERLRASLEYYNSYAAPMDLGEDRPEPFRTIKPPYYLGQPELPRLKIGKLRPTASSLRYYEERMAMALGDDWWREAIESLDFETDEEDSLAGDLLKALEDAREDAREERGHGN
jgi:hypothetical protein